MLTRSEFVQNANQGRLPPVWRRIADVRDPLAALDRLPRTKTLFLLENQSRAETSRFSFLGSGPYARLVLDADGTARFHAPDREPELLALPFPRLLRSLIPPCSSLPGDAPPFIGGAVGYFAYEFGNLLEPVRGRKPPEEPDRPLAEFLLVDWLVAIDNQSDEGWVVLNPWVGANGRECRENPGKLFDHAESRISSIANSLAEHRPRGKPAETDPIEVVESPDPDRYREQVLRAKEYIAAGDIYQANISGRYVLSHAGLDPLLLYSSLRALNPSPFAGLLITPERVIVSNSPERLLRVRGGVVETRPIAGTRPRGATEEADRALARELLLSEKERAEHIMLVDLARNDLGRVCRIGSVQVDEFVAREEYSHVQHIVSNVRGLLRPGLDALDALASLFPGGTITGVPKIRCREIIAEIEARPRGIYTGSLGYLSATGDADFNILIRSAETTRDRIVFGTGAGIVADSDPEREFREIQHKAAAFLSAVGRLTHAENPGRPADPIAPETRSAAEHLDPSVTSRV